MSAHTTLLIVLALVGVIAVAITVAVFNATSGAFTPPMEIVLRRIRSCLLVALVAIAAIASVGLFYAALHAPIKTTPGKAAFYRFAQLQSISNH